MPILPPLPPQPSGFLIVIGQASLTWLANALHADHEALAQLVTQAQEKIIMATDALNQAVSDLQTEVTSHATKIDTELAQLLAASGNNDQAGIDAAAQNIRDLTASLQGLDVKLDADDSAAPTA